MVRGVVAAIILSTLFVQTQSQPDPLTLSIECRSSDQSIDELAFSIRNTGREDTAVLLGISLANGRKYALQDLMLVVRRPGDAEAEEYRYRARDLSTGIAGRIDHWILPLPAGSAYSMPLAPPDFLSTRTLQRPRAIPQPADVSVRLLGKPITYDLNPDMAGLRNVRTWSGEVISNSLQVPGDCRQ